MPPLVGEAVNVTLVPAQIVLLGFAETLNEGITVELTLTGVTVEVPVQALLPVTVTE